MLGFCEKCHDMVTYYTREKKMIKTIKGKEIEYVGKIAICNECDREIFVADIRDYNLTMLDKAFREEEELISVAEMELILDRYNIGKRPLSLLLGWGEGTLTRYLDGDIPTKQYSDILKKVVKDPKYMSELLEENKTKVTGVAYRRCSAALREIGRDDSIDILLEEKIDHVAKYLLVNCSDITPLALQKLLYYSQGFFKAFTSEYLFHNNCEAWIHGPVYRTVYDKYKHYGYNPIEDDEFSCSDIELTKIEKELLDSVIRNFGCYSGKVLEKMTHAEMPWSHTRMGLKDDESSNRIIEKELIGRYFKDTKIKYNMLNLLDIKDYSIELFNKLYK